MDTCISFMRNLKPLTCSETIKLKLRTNLVKGLRPLDLTVVENTMAEMMDKVNNVKDFR